MSVFYGTPWVRNDPRLMRETPEILAISDTLERSAGQYTSYGVVSIGGLVGTILAATNHSRAAVKVAAMAFVALCVGCNLLIWKCGTVLVATIDKSLQNSSAVNNMPTSPIAAAPEGEGGRGKGNDTAAAGRKRAGGDPNLLAARKKIKMAMSICLSMAVQTVLVLTFAVASSYGTAVPLLFFGVPLGLAPLFWFMFNIQMHAGRSKPRVSPGVRSPGTSGHSQQQTFGFGIKVKAMFNSTISRSLRIVLPTETPAST